MEKAVNVRFLGLKTDNNLKWKNHDFQVKWNMLCHLVDGPYQ